MIGFRGESNEAVLTLAEFKDNDGTPRQAVSQWASQPPAHLLGEQVQVFYDPNNPDDARIGRPLYWVVNLIVIVAVLLDAAAGSAMIWIIPRVLRRRRNTET